MVLQITQNVSEEILKLPMIFEALELILLSYKDKKRQLKMLEEEFQKYDNIQVELFEVDGDIDTPVNAW